MKKQFHQHIRLVLALAAVSLAGIGLSDADDSSLRQSAMLSRSDDVVQAKIARKAKKLSGVGENPENPHGLGMERMAARWHPEGTNLTELKLAAIDHTKSMPQISHDATNKDGGVWNWDWLGPGNIGGRVRAILVHPTNKHILWAGSAGGGVWKTDDGGDSWYPLQNFLPSLEVSAMVLDPNNPDVLYAATGEGLRSGAAPSAGIFKSTNGGGIWHQLPNSYDPVDGYEINDLIIHPTNSNILFAAVARQGNNTGLGHIWKSVDAGLNWQEVLETPTTAMDLGIDQDNPNVVLMSYATGVYRSHINGNAGTWQKISTGAANKLPVNTGRTAFAFGVGNDFIYASCDVPRTGNKVQGEIWRSTDNGVTWEQRSVPLHLARQGDYDNVIWLEEGSEGSIIFGGLDLHKSVDGGTTNFKMSDWRFYHSGASAHSDQHVIVPASDYLNGSNTIYVGNDGGVQMAYQGFLTEPFSGWQNLANNLGITQFYHADASPDGSIILAGSQDNDELRYTRSSGAQNWYQAETGDGTFCAINPLNTDLMYGGYVNLQIKKSINGGQSYFNSYSGIGDAGDAAKALFIAPFAMDKLRPDRLIAGGQSIWRTTNNAANWFEVLSPRTNSPKCSAIEIDPLKGEEIVWAGYDNGVIWKSENFTANWSQMDAGGVLPGRFVTDIEVSPFDSDIALVSMSGYTTESVYLSFDGGVNFVKRSGTGTSALPVIQVNTVTFHPDHPDWIYAGTDIGVYASEDLGLTWSVTPARLSNESPVYAEVTDLLWHSGDTLVAATHGRGVYECRPLSIVYVDNTYSGTEDGHFFTPFDSIADGYSFIGHGAALVVKDGIYFEGGQTMDKRITLRNHSGSAVIR